MLEALEGLILPSTFIVTSTADDGTAGTLRWALQQVNASTDSTNTIGFAIGASGSRQTLTLDNSKGPLPSISKPVTIDGSSQGSSSSGPLIQLSGAGTMMIDGLISLAGNVTIQDLAIYGFMGNGIVLNPSSGADVVQGCDLGTDAAGDSGLGNLNGIDVLGGLGNTVGGPQAADGNVISGNRSNGVLVWGGGTVITNDWIGLGVTGSAALGNAANGIDAEAGNMTVTGSVISANQSDGIYAAGTGDVIKGDWIGTDATGKSALGNGTGVAVTGANDTVGDATGAVTTLISGNKNDGIDVSGAGATGDVITSCYVGADVTGLAALANGGGGISLMNAAGGAVVKGNTTNGKSQPSLSLSNSNNNLVTGNNIGVMADGKTSFGSPSSGIRILDSGSGNTIGGAAAADRNIIAGCGGSGVVLSGPNVANNVVEGNYIGLDKNGNKQGNAQYGINLNGGAHGNTIGGTTAGTGNVISGNGSAGVHLSDSGTSHNVICGDLIGTNPAGTAAIANSGNGVEIINCSNNTVGALAPQGANTSLTVISGNGTSSVIGNGVDISGGSNNLVINCYIGTDITGKVAVPNHGDGVRLEGGTSYNTIGGVGGAATRNVISGNDGGGLANRGFGVEMVGTSQYNVVEGNYIGTDSTGMNPVGNANEGVYLEVNSDNNTIGGPLQAAGNVISANGWGVPLIDGYGIEIDSNNNDVDWNFLGRDATGADVKALHNQNGTNGSIDNSGTGNTITTNNKLQAP